MPWCEECSRYLTPNSMTAEGDCPKCGAPIAEPTPTPDDEKAPWHFKLLVAATAAYLLWRFVDIFN